MSAWRLLKAISAVVSTNAAPAPVLVRGVRVMLRSEQGGHRGSRSKQRMGGADSSR